MTPDDLKFAVVALSAVFFVVDPLMAVPLFLGMTARDDAAKRRRTALRAAFATFVTLSVFAITGGLLFKAFGISLGAFKIAGGLMLFLMAIDMMRAQESRTRSTEEEQEEGEEKDDIAVVPMAIPFLAGPGAIATVMVLMSRAGGRVVPVASVFGAILITTTVTWILLRSAASAERFLSKTMLNVMNRVFGLILAAVAVEFVIGGLRDLLPTMH